MSTDDLSMNGNTQWRHRFGLLKFRGSAFARRNGTRTPSSDDPNKKGLLFSVKRGKTWDKEARVSIVVIDGENTLIGQNGKRRFLDYVCLRSTGKPPSAAAVDHSGAGTLFGFDDHDYAVMSASHVGEPEHRVAALSIIDKINTVLKSEVITLNDFQNTFDGEKEKSINPQTICGENEKLLKERALTLKRAKQLVPDEDAFKKLKHACSGQHSGLLAQTAFLELRKWAKEAPCPKTTGGNHSTTAPAHPRLYQYEQRYTCLLHGFCQQSIGMQECRT